MISFTFTSASLRGSVSAAAALAITALIAWSTDAYIGYLHQHANPSQSTAHVESSRDTLNG